MGFARFVVVAWIVGCHSHDKLPAITDSTSPAACPTHLDFELNGGASRFDPGYSGVAHGVGLADHTRFTAEVVDRDPECRRVKFKGPVPPDPVKNPIVSLRCLKDLPTTCTVNADCSGKGPCVYILPPISTSLGAPTCAIAFFSPVPDPVDKSPVEGVFDLATGQLDMERFNIFVDVYLGSCPQCTGDHTQLDGIKDGHCTSDPTTACDIIGNNTQQLANTSYDCPPSGAPLTQITLPGTNASTGDHAWTMDATRPACKSTVFSLGKKCWCGMCPGLNGGACSSSDDCGGAACGAATNGGSGATLVTYATANNACAPGTCTWDAVTQTGTCSSDATKKCFPDTGTIIAHGTAEVRGDGVYNSQIANLTCLPSVGGALGSVVDSPNPGGGFPGPLLFQARFTVTTRVAP